MDRRTRQRQRTMGYFIQAAKEIINEQGVTELSVRNVAKRAGYSFATIYNYFQDINHLLWYVSLEYLNEVTDKVVRVKQKRNSSMSSLDLIKGSFRAYVSYYLENPAAYHLIFFQQLGPPPKELEEATDEGHLVVELMATLEECVADGLLNSTEIPITARVLTAAVHGLLSMYFTDKNQLTEEELLLQLEESIEFILDPKRGRREISC